MLLSVDVGWTWVNGVEACGGHGGWVVWTFKSTSKAVRGCYADSSVVEKTWQVG